MAATPRAIDRRLANLPCVIEDLRLERCTWDGAPRAGVADSSVLLRVCHCRFVDTVCCRIAVVSRVTLPQQSTDAGTGGEGRAGGVCGARRGASTTAGRVRTDGAGRRLRSGGGAASAGDFAG